MSALRVTLLLSLVATTSLAAAPDWSDLEPLLGTWTSDPSPDGAKGRFTFARELDGQVLVRRNVTDLPKTKERPAQHHEDLLVVERDASGTRATYWDNEGHRIDYAVSVEGKNVTFLSAEHEGAPRFRLTYEPGEKSGLIISFDFQPPGATGFKPYLKGGAHRVAGK